MCDWYNQANMLLHLGRLDEALGCFEAAVRNDPSYADGWVNLAIVQHRLGRDAESRASFDRALALDPDHRMALRNKALLLDHLGQTFEAVPLRRRLAELAPDDVEAWYLLAWTCVGAGERYFEVQDVALRAVERALDLDPSRGQAWAMKGEIVWRAWHHRSALEKLEASTGRRLLADGPSLDELAQTALACLPSRPNGHRWWLSGC
jgi:tetratricopeptide (TPR) repeat protein